MSLFSVIGILLTLCLIWLGFIMKSQISTNMLSGCEIGGRFDQTQAKAIDFVCGAVIAPLLMAALNLLWFTHARPSAVYGPSANQVPLTTLVEASHTSTGTYDLTKIGTLLKSRTWKLVLLGILTLLSAVARTSLSNLIAYEAFTEPTKSTQILRLMRDAYLEDSDYEEPSQCFGSDWPGVYNFSGSEQANMAKQVSGMLTGISYEAATNSLSRDGAYISINATSGSLMALDQSVVQLSEVPCHRLSISCRPREPDSVFIEESADLDLDIHINFNRSATQNANFTSRFTANLAIFNNSKINFYRFLAFNDADKSELFLGTLADGPSVQNHANDTTFTSPFGAFALRAFDAHQLGIPESYRPRLWAWGMQCSLERQEGTLNMDRRNGSAATWRTSGAPAFAGEQRRTQSRLFDWQNGLKYHAPMALVPGVGSALAQQAGVAPCVDGAAREQDGVECLDWDAWTANVLFASGEAERMAYEVAAANATRDAEAYYYEVGGMEGVQRYVITYVPAILLVGLVSMIVAAAITAGMAFWSRVSVAAGFGREFDTLRLVVDGVADLREDAQLMAMATRSERRGLERWAKSYKVAYEEVFEEGDRACLRLMKAGENTEKA